MLRDDLKPTGRKGIFYKEHPTRKHGIRKDRLLVIRYTIGGTTRTESLGWTSEGVSELDAEKKILTFRENHKRGSGPTSLAEEREQKKVIRSQEEAKREEEESRNITVSNFWTQVYLPRAQDQKKPDSWGTEERLFRLWIAPVIGHMTFDDIRPFHLEKIKAKMKQGVRADTSKNSKPRPLSAKSIQYALAVVRQVWNLARRDKIVTGDSPSKDVDTPKVQNRRMRFLTRDEADRLLDRLSAISTQLHDIALLSLHTGARASECFNLQWEDVDLERGELLFIDTKNGESRKAYLTPAVLDMLERRVAERGDNPLVFSARTGEAIKEISAAFPRVIKKLGFNEGVSDARKKVTFHTLRHTFASWLVETDVNLRTVGELLGHKTMTMTVRYSHVGADAQKEAINRLSESFGATRTNNGKVLSLRTKRE